MSHNIKFSPVSPIDKIHYQGLVAVLDGTNQKIVRKITKEETVKELQRLRAMGYEADIDRDGDIVYFKD